MIPILLHEPNVDKTNETPCGGNNYYDTNNECKPCPEGHAPVVKMTSNGAVNTHAHICCDFTKPDNASWDNKGVTCDWSCDKGYNKVEDRCEASPQIIEIAEGKAKNSASPSAEYYIQHWGNILDDSFNIESLNTDFTTCKNKCNDSEDCKAFVYGAASDCYLQGAKGTRNGKAVTFNYMCFDPEICPHIYGSANATQSVTRIKISVGDACLGFLNGNPYPGSFQFATDCDTTILKKYDNVDDLARYDYESGSPPVEGIVCCSNIK